MLDTHKYIVQLKNLHREYDLGKNKVYAVQGIDLDIERGKFVSLVGESGCGKTTTLNLIGCIDVPTKGEIIVDGKNINTMHDNDITEFRGKSIGFIFQNFNLIPVLNVRENIAYPLSLANNSVSTIKERVDTIIEYVELSDWANHKPNELSGGQRQRVAIARALVIDPLLVVADEPTANLDSATSFRIIELMKELQQRLHTTFIFATHDPRFFDYMDTIYEMKDGTIIDQQDFRRNKHEH